MNTNLPAALLLCGLATFAASTRAQTAAPGKTSFLLPETLPPSPDALPQAEPPKTHKPHEKLYTNDNLPAASGDFDGSDFSAINDCDRNCFDQVRQLAHVTAAYNPEWKRDVLRALDPVRQNAQWQQYLRDLYDQHVRFCGIGEEKREELARVADPNNVTARELNVDDKYDAKFRKAQSDLQALYLRQRPLQQGFAYNGFSFQFSQIQVSRIQNAACAQQRYTATGPTDADDP
jgi:hypothetical protein